MAFVRFFSACLLIFVFFAPGVNAQVKGLPRGHTAEELKNIEAYKSFYQVHEFSGLTNPPGLPVRSIAEWEELQAIVITWTSYKSLLAQIVLHAQEEVDVIIVCSSKSVAESQLNSYGVFPNANVKYIEVGNGGFDSIWIRDYGPNPAYLNQVDSLVLVDWIYNRNRPNDDVVSEKIADFLGITLYQTVECPEDLVHTGGNFMSDGLGQAMSSKLVLDENQFSPFVICPKNESKVDEIMEDFLGVSNYIKFEKLPYDGIHHIDMHMKLLDEETLLVGAFPDAVSDGPQIEANLQYLLDNQSTSFSNGYNIIRMPMPPCSNGQWPDDCQAAEYRTYVNALFVNKTVLVPTYGIPMDDVALDIWKQALPGYNIVGLNSADIIFSGGAVHCITKEIGVKDPLWIAHPRITELCTDFNAVIPVVAQHKSGIATVEVFYRTDTTASFQSVTLQQEVDSLYLTDLGFFPVGSTVQYYLKVTANSGKVMYRPMPAPEGYYTFDILDPCNVSSSNNPDNAFFALMDIYPNPASAITVVPVNSKIEMEAVIYLTDIAGRRLETLYEGQVRQGETNYFIHAEKYHPGTYFVVLETARGRAVRKVMIK